MQHEAGERIELPQGHWHRYRGVMFRVVENTIGGQVVEFKPAHRHTQRRADHRELDERDGSGV